MIMKKKKLIIPTVIISFLLIILLNCSVNDDVEGNSEQKYSKDLWSEWIGVLTYTSLPGVIYTSYIRSDSVNVSSIRNTSPTVMKISNKLLEVNFGDEDGNFTDDEIIVSDEYEIVTGGQEVIPRLKGDYLICIFTNRLHAMHESIFSMGMNQFPH